jgi:hypothetical protein
MARRNATAARGLRADCRCSIVLTRGRRRGVNAMKEERARTDEGRTVEQPCECGDFLDRIARGSHKHTHGACGGVYYSIQDEASMLEDVKDTLLQRG